MLVVVGAVDASTRRRNKRQHRSRPRLASVDNPWFKEFCAYDGGRDDVRRRETRTRRERAHRGQCEQRQRLARTRRQDLGEDAKRGASSDGRDTRREHTRTMTKLTRCEIGHLKQGVRKTFSHAFRSFFSWERKSAVCTSCSGVGQAATRAPVGSSQPITLGVDRG